MSYHVLHVISIKPDEETVLVSASVKSCFLTSTSDFTELSAAPSSGSVCRWYGYIGGFEIQNRKKYSNFLVNLPRSGNAWWSKRGITSVFRAPNIAFLLLLLLLMVTLPCLLLSPENKKLYFCAKIYFHEKYLQVFKALCWMNRVSSWSRKSFLHSPHVKVSPPTTVGSGERNN